LEHLGFATVVVDTALEDGTPNDAARVTCIVFNRASDLDFHWLLRVDSWPLAASGNDRCLNS